MFTDTRTIGRKPSRRQLATLDRAQELARFTAIGILRTALHDVAGLHREQERIDEQARRVLLNAIDHLART